MSSEFDVRTFWLFELLLPEEAGLEDFRTWKAHGVKLESIKGKAERVAYEKYLRTSSSLKTTGESRL